MQKELENKETKWAKKKNQENFSEQKIHNSLDWKICGIYKIINEKNLYTF